MPLVRRMNNERDNMSAEDTNVDKQAKQHRPALWGMAFAVGVAGVLLVAFLFSVTDGDGDDVEQMISTEEDGS